MREIDRHSSTWAAVSGLCGREIEEAQRRIEKPGLPPVETELLRGMVKAMRKVLALAGPPEEPPVTAPVARY